MKLIMRILVSRLKRLKIISIDKECLFVDREPYLRIRLFFIRILEGFCLIINLTLSWKRKILKSKSSLIADLKVVRILCFSTSKESSSF